MARLQVEAIDTALARGDHFKAFWAGSGGIVVRVEDRVGELKAAGIAMHLRDACLEANNSLAGTDLLVAGQDPDSVVDIFNQLNEWILHGGTIRAMRARGGLVHASVRGTTRYSIPEAVLEQARQASQPISHSNRGFNFRVALLAQIPETGRSYFETSVTQIPTGRTEQEATVYEVGKWGTGTGLVEAFIHTLSSPAIEIPSQRSG